MIVGHEAISVGDILVHDSNVTKLPPLEYGSSMIVQSNARPPYLASLDNVAPSLATHGLEASAARARHRLHPRQQQPGRGDGAHRHRARFYRRPQNPARTARPHRRPLPPGRGGRRPACVAAVDDQGSQVRIALSLGEGVDPSVLLRNEALAAEPGAVAIPRY
jgi:hypothetical protein